MAIQIRPINFRFVLQVIGRLCFFESLFILACIACSFIYQEDDLLAFFYTFLAMLVTGLSFSILGRSKKTDEVGRREGMLTVALTWLCFSLLGTLPFLLGSYTTSFTDAFFESMSGFTTTGATIFDNVESLPHGILLWRSLMQWQGGIGIVVFTVALIPLMGGGMGISHMYNAETTGIIHDRFLPRITQVAKRLWSVYIISTSMLFILLFLGPMNIFDALCHTLTCVSTGGYSTRNAGIAAFDSIYIEYIIVVFMLLSSLSIIVQYFLFMGKPRQLFKDEEVRWFMGIVFIATAFSTLWLMNMQSYSSIESNFRHSLFQVSSLISTTGFLTADFISWGPFFWCIALVIMLICGCAGSTSGGMKVSRFIVLMKNLSNEFNKRTHPSLMVPVRINGIVINGKLVSQVLAFAFAYILLIFLGVMLLCLTGFDFTSAVGSAVSAMGNVGPGFGEYMATFSHANDFSKWILSLLMLTGRLEVFTIILLFHPSFWRR